jgi:PAS domain S-box-containing protein
MSDLPPTVGAEPLAVLLAYNFLDIPARPGFDAIAHLARRICAAPVACVSPVAANRQWFDAPRVFATAVPSMSPPFSAGGTTQGASLVIPDLALDPRTHDNPLVVGPPHLRFYAGMLLATPHGHTLGTLYVIDHTPRPDGLTFEQTENLQALAEQATALLALRRQVNWLSSGLASAQSSTRTEVARTVASEADGDRLRDAAVRVAGLQEAGDTGAFDTDLAKGIVYVSEAFGVVFGLPSARAYPLAELERLLVAEDRHLLSSNFAHDPERGQVDAEFRIRRADDGALRWIARRAEFIRDEAGKALRFVGTLHDVTDRRLAVLRETALLALGDALRTAPTSAEASRLAGRTLGETLLATRAGYAAFDLTAGTYRVEQDWTAPGIRSISGLRPLSSFPVTVARLLDGAPLAISDVETTTWLASELTGYRSIGARSQIATPLIVDGQLVGSSFLHDDYPRLWSSDEIAFARSVADRTHAALAKISAEQQQRLLNEELSHRLKNTIAMVQALASQTLKASTEPAALAAFRHRLETLSTAHKVLLQQNWAASKIRTVIAGVLNRHDDAERITLNGPDITVGPQAVLSLSLLLHELATNATKYGALSATAGSVRVQWTVERQGKELLFMLDWEETGGPAPQTPGRNGFGSRLIQAGLTGTEGASLAFLPSGLLAKFSAPLTRMTSH